MLSSFVTIGPTTKQRMPVLIYVVMCVCMSVPPSHALSISFVRALAFSGAHAWVRAGGGARVGIAGAGA